MNASHLQFPQFGKKKNNHNVLETTVRYEVKVNVQQNLPMLKHS